MRGQSGNGNFLIAGTRLYPRVANDPKSLKVATGSLRCAQALIRCANLTAEGHLHNLRDEASEIAKTVYGSEGLAFQGGLAGRVGQRLVGRFATHVCSFCNQRGMDVYNAGEVRMKSCCAVSHMRLSACH